MITKTHLVGKKDLTKQSHHMVNLVAVLELSIQSHHMEFPQWSQHCTCLNFRFLRELQGTDVGSNLRSKVHSELEEKFDLSVYEKANAQSCVKYSFPCTPEGWSLRVVMRESISNVRIQIQTMLWQVTVTWELIIKVLFPLLVSFKHKCLMVMILSLKTYRNGRESNIQKD